MADILLPDPGIDNEYVIVPKRKEEMTLLREERDAIKLQLSTMEKPTNEELIEYGKLFHIYFIKENELDIIKQKINEL